MDGIAFSDHPRRSAGFCAGGWNQLRLQIERMTARGVGEDLLQDAYVRLAALPMAPSNIEAFLVRSAVNRGHDAYRRERVRGEVCDASDHAPCVQTSPIQDEVMIIQQRLARVKEGVARLPPRTREVHRLDGMRYREIAATLNISQSAVEKHIAKAMTFLADWARHW